MVFELELFWAETLIFLIVKIPEEFMRGELVLVKFCYYEWMLLHFAQKGIDSFVIVKEQFGLNLC